MSASKVLLILGAGGNIGSSVATLFAQNGYNVALAARRLQDSVNEAGQLHIQADLSNPGSVEAAFDKVTSKFGPPNAVVYNAGSAKFTPAENPLDLALADYNQNMAVNTTSVLVAAQQAVQSFERLPSGTPKTFIYTGNFLNLKVIPRMVSMGMGKAATAHLINAASESYGSKGYRFYYADERRPDGDAVYADISGANAAEHYLELAESTDEKPWLQTFVGGKGYVDFS